MKNEKIIELPNNRIEFSFYPDEANKYDYSINLGTEIPADAKIGVIFNLCKRFAICLGYAPETVENCFGPDVEDWDD